MNPQIAEILQISEGNPRLIFEAGDLWTPEFVPETIFC